MSIPAEAPAEVTMCPLSTKRWSSTMRRVVLAHPANAGPVRRRSKPVQQAALGGQEGAGAYARPRALGSAPTCQCRLAAHRLAMPCDPRVPQVPVHMAFASTYQRKDGLACVVARKPQHQDPGI